jgi:hypothetical protein
VTHVEAFMIAEAEAEARYEMENNPIAYALRTGEIDHLDAADLRKYDELRADEDRTIADRLCEEYLEPPSMLSDEKLQKLTERTYTYDDIRVAFESGFASCQDHMDASDAWDEHRSFLASTTKEPTYE